MAPQRGTSNAYATGANQNCGNVISDVSSTRVNKPPGGSSSLNLSWGDQRRGGRGMDQGPRDAYAGPSDGYGPPPLSPSQQAPLARTPGGARTRDWPASQEPPPYPCDAQREAMGGTRGPREPLDGGRGGGAFAGHSPRGGGCLPGGGEQVFGARTRPGSNAYANGADQNCGNVLTDVPTTRVLRPPGGSSAMSLSWEDKPLASPQQDRYGMRQQENPLASSQQDRYIGKQEFRGQQSPREATREAPFGQRPRVSSNTFATGADQNCGNFISDTPTTRVSRPPGGASSLRLG
mmetsp:Transcript_43000/g.133666  ORF Transcript_43000/g.133666 Transcript_43000/m.133666 type:complete len:292 (-) Transcript_43000:37-912(-)